MAASGFEQGKQALLPFFLVDDGKLYELAHETGLRCHRKTQHVELPIRGECLLHTPFEQHEHRVVLEGLYSRHARNKAR